MASPRNCAVALLGRDDGARAQLRHSLEELGASVVFEGEAAGTAAGQLFERAPQVVIVNLADGSDDELDHLQPVFDAPQINVVFNEADVSSRLQGWDLARWARHLAAKVLGDRDLMPPPPPGFEALPLRDLMPVPGAPPTPAQMAPERAIEEFVIEAEDRVDALPEDFMPMPTLQPDLPVERDASLGLDFDAVDGALVEPDALAPRPAPQIVRVEREVVEDDLPDSIELPDLSELDRALEADAQAIVASARSERELLDEALGGLDLDFLADHTGGDTSPAAGATTVDTGAGISDFGSDVAATEPAAAAGPTVPFGALFLEDDTSDDAMPPASAGAAAAPASVAAPSWVLDDDTDASTGESPQPGWIHDGETRAPATAPGDDGLTVEEFDVADAADEFGFTLETDATTDDDAFAQTSDDGTARTETAASATPSWSVDDDDLQYDESMTLDDDVAAMAAQLDAFEHDTGSRFSQAQDPGFSIAPMHDDDADDDVDAPVPSDAPAAAAAPAIDFGTLSLTSMDDAIEQAPRVAQAASFDFSGIDNLTLAPLDDGDTDGDGTGAAAAGVDPLLLAMGLVDAPDTNEAVDGIPRVVVLGASIGGPDALRTFLAGIPPEFPALFLLVQHLENGYFERLAQQLQKATRLRVRALVPDGPFAATGEVLVVPANLRYTVERNGHIEAIAHDAPPHYTPCIDDVLRDAADRFGARTTAIIFSGMAGDAIEGAVYVTAKGGEVWVQDPASCVVSSMVDGARARGVVEYIGSPRELAERCVAQYGN
ncbi:chemotaxis protein CheB [Chiayiivirga flava]|uniref:protein-glutamate methylesterase n=1 Tax=Chiayiivirga flava TaxID=659595 RepID=A0A7W8G130_9GAMM|nr:chemotaxis response regulator CheB [Chiayiivirga flava]